MKSPFYRLQLLNLIEGFDLLSDFQSLMHKGGVFITPQMPRPYREGRPAALSFTLGETNYVINDENIAGILDKLPWPAAAFVLYAVTCGKAELVFDDGYPSLLLQTQSQLFQLSNMGANELPEDQLIAKIIYEHLTTHVIGEHFDFC
jgi:hypothetical protein